MENNSSQDSEKIVTENHVNSLEGDSLIEAVRNQVEYYFSSENLQSDTYLVSQMDANKSVAISTIMRFAKLKALTQDEELVRKSIENSPNISVVEDRIKVNTKPSNRGTIILREIPDDATEEEIRGVFNFEGCKPVLSVRSDIGNTWFVVMETEDDAKDTILKLKLKSIKFRNDPVKARLKVETLSRSFYSVKPSPNPFVPKTSGFSGPSSFYSNPAATGDDDKKDGSRKPSNRSTAGPVREKRGSRNKDSKRSGKADSANVENKGQIEVDETSFPPLQMDDGPLPEPGYKTSFVKYTFDDVINIVKNVRDAPIPVGIHPEEHSLAMTVTPNLDLLQRQRTFSIDETREQLQQGRPVQQMAVVGGSVDYARIMFGDGYSSQSEVSDSGNKHDKKESFVTKRSTGSWAQRLGSGEVTATSTPATTSATKPSSAPASSSAKAPSAVKQTSTASNSTNSSKPTNKAPKEASSNSNSKTSGEKSGSGRKSSEKKPKGEKKEKKEGEESTEKKEKPKKEKKDDKPKAPDSQEGASSPSTWHGKPSFANILKHQE